MAQTAQSAAINSRRWVFQRYILPVQSIHSPRDGVLERAIARAERITAQNGRRVNFATRGLRQTEQWTRQLTLQREEFGGYLLKWPGAFISIAANGQVGKIQCRCVARGRRNRAVWARSAAD